MCFRTFLAAYRDGNFFMDSSKSALGRGSNDEENASNSMMYCGFLYLAIFDVL